MNRIFINQLFISYTILQIVIQRFIIKFDEAGRIPLLLFLLIIILNNKNKLFKKVFFSRPVIFWTFLCAYSMINWYLKGIYTIETMPKWVFISQSMILPLGMMGVTCYEVTCRSRKTIMLILYSFVVYLIIGNLFQNHGTGIGTGWSARGGLILGNRLPLTAVATTFVALVAYIRNFINKKRFVSIMLLSLYSIIWIATRKAFGGYVILVVFFIFTKMDYKNPRNIILLLGALCLLYLSISMILSHSALGIRMGEVEEQGMLVNESNNLFLNFLGDRALHYILGWDLFLSHPLTGIGLRNFQYYTDFPVPIHSEYMIQICENGIIGIILWLLFILNTVKSSFHTMLQENREGMICFGGLVSLLFICFTAWFFDMPYFMCMLGVIIALCNGKTKYCRNSIK